MPATEDQPPRSEEVQMEQASQPEGRIADEMTASSGDDDDLPPSDPPSQEKLALRQGSARGCWPRSRVGKGLCGLASTCCTALLLAVVVGAALLWPRKPTWELQTLDFDKDQLGGLISTFTGQSNGTIPSMVFKASVELHNPNFVRATAEPGDFAILFNNLQMGTGTSLTLKVPARSSVLLPVNVSVDLNSQLVQDLNHAVTADNFVLPITTVGSAEVTIPTGFRVHCHVECKIQASVLKLLSEPSRVVSEQDCVYHYDIF